MATLRRVKVTVTLLFPAAAWVQRLCQPVSNGRPTFPSSLMHARHTWKQYARRVGEHERARVGRRKVEPRAPVWRRARRLGWGLWGFGGRAASAGGFGAASVFVSGPRRAGGGRARLKSV